MELELDLDPEEMAVLINELDNNLKILEDNLELLINGRTEVITSLHRAAHTIKGSSSIIGYEKMVLLSRAMETWFNKFSSRQKDLSVEMTAQLYRALEGLQQLAVNLKQLEDSELNMDELLAGLNQAEDKPTQSSEPVLDALPLAGSNIDLGDLPPAGSNISLDANQLNTINNILDSSGGELYNILICFEEHTPVLFGRVYVVLADLKEKGQIICSRPTLEDFEQGIAKKPELEIITVSTASKEDLQTYLSQIADVKTVLIKALTI